MFARLMTATALANSTSIKAITSSLQGSSLPAKPIWCQFVAGIIKTLNTNDVARYFVDVPAGYFLHRFSFLTTWHRVIIDTNPGPGVTLTATLNNVDVSSYTSFRFFTGHHDRLEYQPKSIMWNTSIYPFSRKGEYVFEVEADGPADCGVAWFGTLALVPVPEPPVMASNGTFSLSAQVSSNIPYQIEAKYKPSQ